MMPKKFVAAVSAVALMAAGPAFAQATAPATADRAAASLSPSNALGGTNDDAVGWAMAGLVLAAVAYVLISIALDDDDDDSEPVSP